VAVILVLALLTPQIIPVRCNDGNGNSLAIRPEVLGVVENPNRKRLRIAGHHHDGRMRPDRHWNLLIIEGGG
jgi:hypothetical protein